MQFIKALDAANGNGTSMISLILPPKDQVNRHPVLLHPLPYRCGCTSRLAFYMYVLSHIASLERVHS